MNERKQSTLIGWGAIVLFAIGSLGTVTMFMSMKYADRLAEQGKLGEFAQVWISALGLFPSLFLNAALLFLGARLFIKGGARTLTRNLVGSIALTVALAIFFGGLHAGSGGWIGAHTGEVVTSRAHIALGALVGLVSVFAAVWFAWLRQSTMGRPAFATSKATTEPAPKPAPKPLARPVATRLSTPQTAASDEGVTAAESEALFPFEAAEPKPIAALPIVAVTPAAAHQEVVEAVAPMPRSPYPEDLRRKGQIPPGAKPLESPSMPQTTAPAAYKWTAPRTSEEESTATDATFETAPVARGPRPLRRVEDDDAPMIEDVDESPMVAAHDEHALGEDEEIAAPMRAEALDVEAEAPVAGIPTPSWEQPAMFRPEAGDEEPVDAYGTPLTLVEKLRAARRLAGLERDDAHVVEELAGNAEESTTAGELSAVGLSAAELDELMESPLLDEEDVDEDADEDVETDDIEAEDEIQPVRSRAIPREIDAGYESAVDETELDEAEVDDEAELTAANAEDFEADTEDFEADAGELEDATVVVGLESIDDEDIVLTEDDVLVPAASAKAAVAIHASDMDDAEDDMDEDEDEEDEILVTESIDEDADVAVPMTRASAEPVLEPLVLPAVAPMPRSEPIQPGLFDAPAPIAHPTQTAAAQSKPAMQPVSRPVEVAKASAQPATAKIEPAPTKIDLASTKPATAKIDLAPTKSQAAPSKSEPAPKKPEVAAKKTEAVPSKSEAVSTKPEPVQVKSEATQAKSEPAPAKSAKPRAATSPEKSAAGPSEKSAAGPSEKSAAGPSEKDVVLQPTASTSAKPATSAKSTSTDTPRPKLLSEIGCLFIERGRVAVSMLQRQYSMDFDEACKVLDDLQEMGLIGPYLGGQRRDILLTRDQWLERVSQAGAAR